MVRLRRWVEGGRLVIERSGLAKIGLNYFVLLLEKDWQKVVVGKGKSRLWLLHMGVVWQMKIEETVDGMVVGFQVLWVGDGKGVKRLAAVELGVSVGVSRPHFYLFKLDTSLWTFFPPLLSSPSSKSLPILPSLNCIIPQLLASLLSFSPLSPFLSPLPSPCTLYSMYFTIASSSWTNESLKFCE